VIGQALPGAEPVFPDQVTLLPRRQSVPALLADAAVWRYGLALLIGHALCLGYLISRGGIYLLLDGPEPICWPFFEACGAIRFSWRAAPALLAGVYLALLALGLTAWLHRRPRVLRWCLAAATGLLAGIISLDYRLRQNQYYMFLWTNLVYLLARDRRRCLQILIVLFYFWAGTLKLNREWLSGAVLYNNLWFVPRTLVPVACGYVVLLELVIIWGLLARSRLVFWSTFAQVALFHLMSLSQINWFYPAIMFTILSIFVLVWTDGSQSTWRWRWGELKAVSIVVLLFSACQLVPRSYGGDPALHGQGRTLALHMFEARQDCQVEVVFHHRDGRTTRRSLLRKDYPPRLVCDTVVYYGLARNLCRKLPPGVSDFDLSMMAKRRTDSTFAPVIEAPGFCQGVRDFKVLGRNWWLLTGEFSTGPTSSPVGDVGGRRGQRQDAGVLDAGGPGIRHAAA
jgi:hypothetical protein